MAIIAANEPVGTSARLNVLRLGAGRLGAIMRGARTTPVQAGQLVPTTGRMGWERSDGNGGDTNDGQPPTAAAASGWSG
jgi:hypothetical protein